MEDLKAPAAEASPPTRRPTFFHHVLTRVEAVGLSLVVGFLACGAIVILFGLLAREVFLTARAGPLDREITIAVRSLHTPERDRAVQVATFFGSHLFLIPATALVAAGLKWKGHWVSALLFSGSVAGGFLLNSLLKISFHRARPDLWPALVGETTYSFPSGHAAMSTVFFGGIAAVVFHLTARRGPRIVAVVFALFAVVTVAGTRVYLGAHWTSDIAAGVLVGLFWVVVSAAGTEFVYRRVTDPSPAPPETHAA